MRPLLSDYVDNLSPEIRILSAPRTNGSSALGCPQEISFGGRITRVKQNGFREGVYYEKMHTFKREIILLYERGVLFKGKK